VRISRELVQAYRREIRKHIERCRDACRRVGGRFVDVPVEVSLDIALRRAFAAPEHGKEMKR
jgi:hypothetical protein